MCTHHGQYSNTIYQNPQSFTISGLLHSSLSWTILKYHSLIQLFAHDVHALFIMNYMSIYVIQCFRPVIHCLVVWITDTDVILGQKTSLGLSCLNSKTYPSFHPYLLADLKHIRDKQKDLIVRSVAILHAMLTASSFPEWGDDNSLKRHRGFLETLLPKKTYT